MKIGELKSVFSPVRHENLRALLRYSAESFGEDDASLCSVQPCCCAVCRESVSPS